eukprot:Ihof_evm5s218 gene=Ihof_evmTU5s218
MPLYDQLYFTPLSTIHKLETHKVIIDLSTRMVGTFETYLVVENMCNPDDLKTLRVRMEVLGTFRVDHPVSFRRSRRSSGSIVLFSDVDSQATPSEIDTSRSSSMQEVTARNYPVTADGPLTVADSNDEGRANYESMWEDDAVSHSSYIGTPALIANSSGAYTNQDRDQPVVIYVGGVYKSDLANPRRQLNMGTLYTDRVYNEWSFLIRNNTDISMDFVLSSTLAITDACELTFSTEMHTSVICNSLLVGARSTVTVYLHFYANVTNEERLRLAETSKTGENSFLHKEFEVYINCRLIREYQQSVTVTSHLRLPTFTLSNDMVLFRGACMPCDLPTVEIPLTMDPPRTFVTLLPCGDIRPVIEIRNGSIYFDVHEEISVQGSITIRIVPRIQAILADIKHLVKEKYMNCCVTVFNKECPTENLPIRVCLGFGHLRHYVVMTKEFRVSNTLQLLVTGFIRAFRSKLAKNYTDMLLPYVAKDGEEATDRSINKLDKAAEQELYLDFVYLTSELIRAGLNVQGTHLPFHLSLTLYSLVFSASCFSPFSPSALQSHRDGPRCWPELLAPWVYQLGFYLSFFPLCHDYLRRHYALHHKLVVK